MSEETKVDDSTPIVEDSQPIDHQHVVHLMVLDVSPRFQQFFVVWFLAVALLIVLKKGFQQ